jgi:hypothetical protein
MSFPADSEFLAFNWGADGEPFVFLAPTTGIDTTQLGWGADGEPFNYANGTSSPVPPAQARPLQMVIT